jgi:pimeloyl-ACP methyl ester carboxylesterase
MRGLIAVLLLASCAHVPPPGIHVDDGGRGAATPVVFVHGNGANLEQWRSQLEHVRRSRRAVAFDLRGMGQSAPAADGDYSVAAMAVDLGAVVDALRVRRFILVGHSYGGAVVAKYAAMHPDRVAGVVFADSAGNVKISDEGAANFERAIRKNREGVVEKWFGPILKPSSEATRAEVLSSVRKSNLDAFVNALDGLRHIDMKQLIDAYPGPKIAIVAADIESPASLHVQFPEIPVKKMRGVGHWLMLDDPAGFNALLDEALNAIAAVGK